MKRLTLSPIGSMHWWFFNRYHGVSSCSQLLKLDSAKPSSLMEVHHQRPNSFFPTCQVRVVRFYVSCLLLSSSPLLLLLNRDPRRAVFSVGPQPRPSTPSVPCRTSTTTIHAQCSLSDLNHDHPRPVFPAGPQPRPCTPSVPCRTSTASIHAKCSLPDLM